MKKIIFILFWPLCITLMNTKSSYAGVFYPIYSPYPDQATASKLMTRPLIIEIREINEKEKQKLTKNDPEQLEFLQAYNTYYQESLKDYFESKYSGSKEIILMRTTSVDSLLKTGTKKYTVLRGGNLKRNFDVSGKQMNKDTYSFSMFLSEEEKPKFIVSFTEELLTDTDFLFLVQQINGAFKNASSGGYSPDYESLNKNFQAKITGKKMLIPESMLNEKLTKEDIIKVYSLPIEFVSDEDFQNKIGSESKDYVYLAGSFSASLLGYTCIVVSAETGETILSMASGGVTFYVASRPPKDKRAPIGDIRQSRRERNKFSVTLFSIKPKFSVKESHFEKMMKFAKK